MFFTITAFINDLIVLILTKNLVVDALSWVLVCAQSHYSSSRLYLGWLRSFLRLPDKVNFPFFRLNILLLLSLMLNKLNYVLSVFCFIRTDRKCVKVILDENQLQHMLVKYFASIIKLDTLCLWWYISVALIILN